MSFKKAKTFHFIYFLPLFQSFVFLLLFQIMGISYSSADQTPESAGSIADSLWPADLLQISSTEGFSKHVILVDKKERQLYIYERAGQTIKKILQVAADIGKNDGNKTKRDDHKTPEGIYFLQKTLTPPEIPFNLYGRLAFTTDYPNYFDRLEGKTGSGIWLHSIPDSVALTRGSRGCVVVRNEVINQLQSYIKLKETPLIIYDKLDYISEKEHKDRRTKMGAYLDSWISAWQSMDLDKYMSFYDSSFTAPGFNYKSWKKHKENLKNRYKYIKVTLSQPFLLLHREQLIIKTLQKYESDAHTDYGVKTIYALKRGDEYKIIREEWIPSHEDGTILGSGSQGENQSENQTENQINQSENKVEPKSQPPTTKPQAQTDIKNTEI